jgi:hypothetical protein
MDAAHGLAAILRDAAKMALLRMRSVIVVILRVMAKPLRRDEVGGVCCHGCACGESLWELGIAIVREKIREGRF